MQTFQSASLELHAGRLPQMSQGNLPFKAAFCLCCQAKSLPCFSVAMLSTLCVKDCCTDTATLELGPSDWPQGCLGYAFNLVRPVQPGHRRRLLYAILSQVGCTHDVIQSALASRHQMGLQRTMRRCFSRPA